ncbi:MAG: hypothetical protein JJT89_03270 [Nitriliruptoraceae bacterium]|nr:hypothetical protein [Nitriliruptoraceae bacterium]
MPVEQVAALLDRWRQADGMFGRGRILAEAVRLLRGLTPDERRLLARALSERGAPQIAAQLEESSGGTLDAEQVRGIADQLLYMEDDDLARLVDDLRDPQARAQMVQESIDRHLAGPPPPPGAPEPSGDAGEPAPPDASWAAPDRSTPPQDAGGLTPPGAATAAAVAAGAAGAAGASRAGARTDDTDDGPTDPDESLAAAERRLADQQAQLDRLPDERGTDDGGSRSTELGDIDLGSTELGGIELGGIELGAADLVDADLVGAELAEVGVTAAAAAPAAEAPSDDHASDDGAADGGTEPGDRDGTPTEDGTAPVPVGSPADPGRDLRALADDAAPEPDGGASASGDTGTRSERARCDELARALRGCDQAMARLQLLDAETLAPLRWELAVELLDAIPAGWQRRRAVTRLASAGALDGVDPGEVLRRFERRTDVAFVASSLVRDAGLAPDRLDGLVEDAVHRRLTVHGTR